MADKNFQIERAYEEALSEITRLTRLYDSLKAEYDEIFKELKNLKVNHNAKPKPMQVAKGVIPKKRGRPARKKAK